MSHLFGDLLTQHLHRKHGLSQAKLAAGILQTPSIISEMCQGKRLQGRQARERVVAILVWLQQQDALATADEANALLAAAGLTALRTSAPDEGALLQQLALKTGALHDRSRRRELGREGSVTKAMHIVQGAIDARLPAQVETVFVTPVQLPVEPLPVLAPLPMGSLMPLRTNPLFVGRTGDLQALASAFHTGDTVAVSQVQTAAATGLGGIGKTQLACEFVHRYGQFFPGGVFWLSFADADSVPAEIAACGGAGGLNLRTDFGAYSLAEQVQLVQRAWQSAIPRLLVFDNCEDPKLLAKWRPTSGGCRVLITSRRGEWEPAVDVHTLLLGVLQRAESLTLLRKQCLDGDAAILDAIAEELGDLPLALHLAGSYLYCYPSVAPADYLQQLRNPLLLHHRSMQGEGFSPTGHMQHVGRTFALSYDRLVLQDASDQLAHRLLVHTAHFAPGEPVWYRLLVKTLNLNPDTIEDAERADRAFARLIELGLVETSRDERSRRKETLRMHRLVAAFVRDVAHSEVESSQKAVEAVVYAETAQRNHAVEPLSLLAWQLHLRAVVDIAKVREDVESARLCHELGQHLWQIGDYVGALPYIDKALSIRERLLGEDQAETAQSLDSMGRLMRALGRTSQTRPYLERALAIRLQLFGEMHAETAISLDNLGRCWHEEEGNPQQARPLLTRALTIAQTILGDNVALTAEFHNNLARCLKAVGELEAALAHFQRALMINTNTLGPEHPHTALIHNNIGALLYSTAHFGQARVHFEHALAIRRKVYGDNHPDTGQTVNNLGVLCRDTGDLEAAQHYLEEALQIFQATVGDVHLQTAIAHRNLAFLLSRRGKTDEAVNHLQRTIVIRQTVLGPDHPLVTEAKQDLMALSS